MATRASTLTRAAPAPGTMLTALWLTAAAVVLAIVLAAAVLVGRATPTGTDPSTGSSVSKTDPAGPAPAHQPFRVNGKLCAQCR